jgi:hypothetical protein
VEVVLVEKSSQMVLEKMKQVLLFDLSYSHQFRSFMQSH